MKREPAICPTHPGAVLRLDAIPAVGKSKSEFASLLGVSRKRLNDILAERKPITPELAVKLAKLFGNSPELWSGLQNKHDIWHACRKVDISTLPSFVDAEREESRG